jgi:transcriptional regulator with XRE-family HTH domain
VELNQGNLGFEVEKSEIQVRGTERSKTPLRMRYDAQVGVIKRQIGDLDEIRLKLGLSRRKMCQLLLVDPSSWTRWTKEGQAPPHIFRALEWYMLLTKEAPAQAHSYWISTVQGGNQMRESKKDEDQAKAIIDLENQIAVEREIRKKQGLSMLFLWVISVVALYLLKSRA